MKALVVCERSGKVRNALAARGHDAWSCDIVSTNNHINGLFHLKQCALEAIDSDDWDILIAFPECTHLTSAGAVYWPQKQADGRQQKAIDFVLALYNSKIPKIAIENPAGILSTVWRKPDQIIHPCQFGDPYRKRTCLWLKGLPKLIPTDIVEPIASWHSGSTRGGKKKDGTRTKSKLPALHSKSETRSITFDGIAKAMAEQWS